MKKTATRRIVTIIIILAILAAIIGISVFSLKNYHKNNTWATLQVSIPFYDNPGKKYECIEGKEITVADGLVIKIGRIEHDGTLNFTVKEGWLYDAEGNELKNCTLHLNEGKIFNFLTSDPSMSNMPPVYKMLSLCVTENWYA